MERIVYMMIKVACGGKAEERAKWDGRNLGFLDVSVASGARQRLQRGVQCFCLVFPNSGVIGSGQLYNCCRINSSLSSSLLLKKR